MSSIITSILGSTVGLLLNKARDSVANKLKDGSLTDQQLRQIIVRDLSDIKSKLDCLSLKDLDSSYSFLKEGVSLLNHALEKCSNDEKSSEGHTEATGISNDSASGILNTVLPLPQAIQRLKISSEERFVSARDCFKEARKAATHAFNNKSLNIKDRIMACKLRMAARILETGFEDPEAATTSCLLSLQELHGLPAIKDMFSIFLKEGFRAKLKKTERLENIMSVLLINDALFDFAAKYSSQYPNVFTWPGIVLTITVRTFSPILNAAEILTKTSIGEELVQQLNRTVVDERLCRSQFAVNSRGEVILLRDDKIIVIYPTGESKDVMFPDPIGTESNLVGRSGKSVAVDSDDNVYVVVLHEIRRDENGIEKNVCDHVLCVFDGNYNPKHCSILDFLKPVKARRNLFQKRKSLIMIKDDDNQVYVYDNAGQLKSKFERDGREQYSLIISEKSDIIIPSDDRYAINLYTTKGNLKSTMKVPEGHDIWRVAFHHGICKIIVLTYVKKQDSYFLLCYSGTGDLENSVFLCKRDPEKGCWMASHSSGLVAVSWGERITFI